MDGQSRQPFNPLIACLAALAALFFLFPLIGLVTGAPLGLHGQRDHQQELATGD